MQRNISDLMIDITDVLEEGEELILRRESIIILGEREINFLICFRNQTFAASTIYNVLSLVVEELDL